MPHKTTVSRHWDDTGRPYWWARCTCARWEIMAQSRAAAHTKARKHEETAR